MWGGQSDARCEALVLAGNFRRAYTEAVQAQRVSGSVSRVRWLRERAVTAGQTRVVEMCDEFLRRLDGVPVPGAGAGAGAGPGGASLGTSRSLGGRSLGP
jgi:hypothetical protein